MRMIDLDEITAVTVTATGHVITIHGDNSAVTVEKTTDLKAALAEAAQRHGDCGECCYLLAIVPKHDRSGSIQITEVAP